MNDTDQPLASCIQLIKSGNVKKDKIVVFFESQKYTMQFWHEDEEEFNFSRFVFST